MRLKHVLFSSLFLSAAFVACTNEELIDVQTPSTSVTDAISLGEGFTISGAKVIMEPGTKSFFEEEPTGINTYWEETDVLGAAWYNAVNAIGPNGYVTGVEKANANHEFAWNADFLFKEYGSDKSSAYFEAKTNLSAGAYVVYYPWNEEVAQVFDEIPVTLKFPYTVNLAEGHEYDAVSDNMFSYGVAAFVPGGRQTDKFYTKQVPVLYGLRLGADHLKLVDLDDMQTIDRIVIEAYDADGNTVLTTAGEVTPPDNTTVKNYNDYIDFIAAGTGSWDENPLPKATYASLKAGEVNHYTIVLENSNQSKYQISTVKDQLTDRIIFSSLPTMKEATKLVVKVITTEGLNLTKTFDVNNGTAPEKAAAAPVLAKFNTAQNEGAMVQLDVFVDTQSDDNIIYTADQFKAQWAEAIAADEAKTLVVADPVILEDIVLENTNPDANVTIELDNSQVNAALTLKGINIERGALTIERNNVIDSDFPVIVDGDIISSANLNINGTVSAKNIILNSNSNTMTIAAMESLEVRESGNVTLNLPEANYLAAGIGDITVYRGGQLRVAKGYMNGAVEVKDGGNFSITGDVTNLGTLNGKVTGNGKFINAKDATATLAAGSNVKVENKEGATLNINGGVASNSSNAGTINVVSGTLDVVNLTQEEDAVINVAKEAKVTGNNPSLKGWIIIKDMQSKDGNLVVNNLAFSVESAADFTAKSGVNAYFINVDLKNSEDLIWNAAPIYFYVNQTINGTLSTNKDVRIMNDITISTTNEEDGGTLSVTGAAQLYVRNATLTLGEGIVLNGDGSFAGTEDVSNTKVTGNWVDQVKLSTK